MNLDISLRNFLYFNLFFVFFILTYNIFIISIIHILLNKCFFRRDNDGFLNAPKYEVVPTLKRYALRQQIEEANKKGKDTTYLKAALEYVDVEEAIYRAEEGAFTLEN